MSSQAEIFLSKACSAAKAAGHIWPEYAACEAALESGWGVSELAVKANNLFGQKQSHPPLDGAGTLELTTREFLRGAWVRLPALWAVFPSWEACFKARMELLRKESAGYPAYALALTAETGEEFIREVSTIWSTDPERANKVLSIYNTHGKALAGALLSA